MTDRFIDASSFLCRDISEMLQKLDKTTRDRTVEIRLKRGGPIALTALDRSTLYLKNDGSITANSSFYNCDRYHDGAFLTESVKTELGFKDGCKNDYPFSGISGSNLYLCTDSDIDQSFLSICNYSVHTHQQEICQGYIGLKWGHRAGIAGRGVTDGKDIVNITDISSINLRIARQIKGCALPLRKILSENQGILIAGPPLCGKTTILRDAVRMVSNGEAGYPKRVLLADERGELSAMFNGRAYNDMGINTDIYTGVEKSEAINLGIRVMSPQLVACDEISEEQSSALTAAFNSGVAAICTAHAGNADQLRAKSGIYSLIKKGVFKRVVFLNEKGNISQITDGERI